MRRRRPHRRTGVDADLSRGAGAAAFTIGRAGRVTRTGQGVWPRNCSGGSPRATIPPTRALPTLGDACEEYIVSGHDRAENTERAYRATRAAISATGSPAPWTPSPAATARAASASSPSATVRCPTTSACRSCARFTAGPASITRVCGTRWSSVLRRAAFTTARHSGGYRLRPRCWRAGMEAAVRNPVHRDLLLFGLYTGDAPGRDHAASVGRVDLDAGLFRVDETKTGAPLELPVTRQLGKILARGRQSRSGARESSPYRANRRLDDMAPMRIRFSGICPGRCLDSTRIPARRLVGAHGVQIEPVGQSCEDRIIAPWDPASFFDNSVPPSPAFLGGHLSFAQKGSLSLCANRPTFHP